VRGSRRVGWPRPARIAAGPVLAVAALVLLVGTAVAQVAPSLELAPASGEVGTAVTATLEGFGGCRADVGDDVGSDAGTVRLLWEGDREVATGAAEGPVMELDFVVPDNGAPGEHRVLAVCVDSAEPTASTTFTVSPVVQLVDVPDVIGATREEARRALEEAGLVLGTATPADGLQVRTQVPGPGEMVTPGTAVDVELEPASADEVVVPDVVGHSVAEAATVLEGEGLALGDVVGDGERIAVQVPSAGASLPLASAVDVELEPASADEVVVPDVVGRSVAEAATVLEGEGLALGDVTGDGERVAVQVPSAGASLPLASAVDVELAAVVGPQDRDLWPWVLAAAVAVGVALLVARALRHQRERRRVREDVHVQARPLTVEPVDVEEEREGERPTISVGLAPRMDPGTCDLEEEVGS
jgi:hypothetical protein